MRKLKSIAYCRAFGSMDGKVSYDALVITARSFLGRETKTLYNDPIWDEYTPEEILIEFFQYKFAKDEDFKKDFEVECNVKDLQKEDTMDWLDEMVAQAEREADEDLSYTPLEKEI